MSQILSRSLRIPMARSKHLLDPASHRRHPHRHSSAAAAELRRTSLLRYMKGGQDETE